MTHDVILEFTVDFSSVCVCVSDPGVQGQSRMRCLWLLLSVPKWCLFKELIHHLMHTKTHTHTSLGSHTLA